MKFNFQLTLIIVILFVVLVSGVNLTQAHRFENDSPSTSTLANPAHYPWKSMYVQREPNPVRDVGRYVSMALRPFDDYPVIAYYDSTNGDLMIAIPVGFNNGNCGTNYLWLCQPVDSGFDYGTWASLDIWGDSTDLWKLGISYRDATNGILKVYILTCIQGSCTPSFSSQGCSGNDGSNVSFKFDSNGYAAVAYYRLDLMYAHQVSLDQKTDQYNPSITWQCSSVIDYFTSYPDSISLSFRNDDVPYITYHIFDSDEFEYRFGYATSLVDPYHFCDPETNWSCYKVANLQNAGLFASLTAPKSENDPTRIAYIDETSNHLYYFESGWGSFMVDELGERIESRGISMQIDNNGYPVIAYQKIESDFSPPALWIARPYMAYDDGEFGNCGDIPPGMGVQYWRCTPLDTGNQYVSEARYISLVINSKGLLAVAYSELDEYDHFMSLKFIYQYLYKNFIPLTIKE